MKDNYILEGVLIWIFVIFKYFLYEINPISTLESMYVILLILIFGQLVKLNKKEG